MEFTPFGLSNFIEILRNLCEFGIVMDSKLVLSSAQAQTSVATHDSTNVLDFGATQDPGVGTPLWCTVAVQTALAGASGSTLKVQAVDAADGSTYAVVWATSIGTAAGFAGAATSIFSVAAGTKLWNAPLPGGLRRYFKIQYVIGTTVLSAGAFDAYIHNGGA